LYDSLANVAQSQGNLEQAARQYADSLALRKKLAETDPTNADWQRDLAVSYSRLGEIAEAQGNADDARLQRTLAIEILTGMIERGLPLSPEDQRWLKIFREKVAAPAPAVSGSP
jgi:tetratricopeptide (TPR) repeat protein